MKTEIGFAIVGSAAVAVCLWLAFALLAEPFYSSIAVFLAGFWGATAGAGFWAAMNRWERRHGKQEYKPSIIWPRR